MKSIVFPVIAGILILGFFGFVQEGFALSLGQVEWSASSYPPFGVAVVQIIDPDNNLNSDSLDNFVIDVYSTSDAGGTSITVTETGEATGTFEGTVFLTLTDESSGHRLRIALNDIITAEYDDATTPTGPVTISATAEILFSSGFNGIKCTHTPVLIQPGVQTTIVAEAVDIMGNAVVDTIEIWTNEGFVFSPQIAAQNFASSTLSYSKTFTDTSISYSCKAVTNGFEYFSENS